MKKLSLLFICLLVTVAVISPMFFPDLVGAADGIKNPLKSTSIQAFIGDALKFVVNLLAVVGVMYIIWTGFLFVKAQGNAKELEVARASFFNAIIGMAIILGAWAIANVITNTINKITNNNDVTLTVPRT